MYIYTRSPSMPLAANKYSLWLRLVYTVSLSFVLSLPPPFCCIIFQLVIGVQQSTQFSDLLDDLLSINIGTCLLCLLSQRSNLSRNNMLFREEE